MFRLLPSTLYHPVHSHTLLSSGEGFELCAATTLVTAHESGRIFANATFDHNNDYQITTTISFSKAQSFIIWSTMPPFSHHAKKEQAGWERQSLITSAESASRLPKRYHASLSPSPTPPGTPPQILLTVLAGVKEMYRLVEGRH